MCHFRLQSVDQLAALIHFMTASGRKKRHQKNFDQPFWIRNLMFPSVNSLRYPSRFFIKNIHPYHFQWEKSSTQRTKPAWTSFSSSSKHARFAAKFDLSSTIPAYRTQLWKLMQFSVSRSNGLRRRKFQRCSCELEMENMYNSMTAAWSSPPSPAT